MNDRIFRVAGPRAVVHAWSGLLHLIKGLSIFKTGLKNTCYLIRSISTRACKEWLLSILEVVCYRWYYINRRIYNYNYGNM